MGKIIKEKLMHLYDKEKQDEIKKHSNDSMYVFKIHVHEAEKRKYEGADWHFLYLKHSIVLDIIESINNTDD